MRRAVEKHIEDPLAEHLLRGDVKEGDTVRVSYDEEKKRLTFSADATGSPPQPETAGKGG